MNSSLYTSIQNSITDNVCGAISISFIYCSSSTSFFTGLDTLFAQAASQGQSVFIASGDWGAAGLQYQSGACVTGTTQNASEMAASPHVTAVGGTMFNPQYDASGNDISVVGVAPGGIETAWGSSGGGVSKIFPKPAWQSGPGVPNDSARDLPDVSMIAWTPGVFIGADVKRRRADPVLLGRHQPLGSSMGGILAGDRETEGQARVSDCSIRLSTAWPTMASSPTESRTSSAATILLTV